MFSFLFRKKAKPPEENKIKPLYEGDRGTKDLHNTSSELRVWLPEPLKVAMQEVTERAEITVSGYIRQFLVVYLYGSHELLCMQENATGIYHPPPPPPPPPSSNQGGIRFSRARMVDYVPGLGKNIVPLKLYLHEKMKADLQALADKAGIPLSQFMREVLVSHFLGHTVWPERKWQATPEQQALAEGWAQWSVDELCAPYTTPEAEAALEGRIEEVDTRAS
jgi:hypothetical protein